MAASIRSKVRNVMLNFAKAVHEALGIDSPRTFIVVFGLFGFALFASLGWLIVQGHRVKLREEASQAVVRTATPQAPPPESPPPTPQSQPTRPPDSPAGGAVTEKDKSPSQSFTVTSHGQQGGITAGIVNVDTQKRLLLTDAQYADVRSSLAPGGGTVRLIVERPTTETEMFARKLAAALSEAGFQVKPERHGMYVSNYTAQPGPWFIAGAQRMDEAKRLASVLVKSGVMSGPIQIGPDDERADNFTIVVSPM